LFFFAGGTASSSRFGHIVGAAARREPDGTWRAGDVSVKTTGVPPEHLRLVNAILRAKAGIERDVRKAERTARSGQ
jgi:hypothetical protein